MFPAATTPPKLSTLILLTALSVLSLNMFLPSLANMAEDFAVDYALVSLSIAGYLALTSVLQVIMGPLSDRYGRRPILLIGLFIFAIASLVCALATDIWVFLAFRVLQGAIISGAALTRAVIRDMAPEREAASMMGYVGMVMAIAPMLGPAFGGLLDEMFGWRASFYVFFVFGLMILALCWADLGETNVTRSDTIRGQFRTYPELFGSRRFWAYTLCMTMSTGAFYTFLAGAPLIASQSFAMSPAVLGIVIGTITAGFMFGSFLSGRYARRFKTTTMMLAGRIVASAGLAVGIVLVLFGVVHPVTLFGATICVGIGNGLTMPSATAGALSVRPGLAGSASGLSGALGVLGGAVLTTLTGSLVTLGAGPLGLLIIMILCTLTGLAATLYIARLDRIEPRPSEVPVTP
jgi:Bcr/CflA subfamily drug resistance transporter